MNANVTGYQRWPGRVALGLERSVRRPIPGAPAPFPLRRGWMGNVRWDWPQKQTWPEARRGTEADVIRAFYRGKERQDKDPLPDLRGYALTTESQGLGDLLQITSLPRVSGELGRYTHITYDAKNPVWRTLCQFNPYLKAYDGRQALCMGQLGNNLDLGNGQHAQRMQRAFGYRPEARPRGCLVVDGAVKVRGRCSVHVEPSPRCSAYQREHIHARARMVYPENLAIIEALARRPGMEFFEVGHGRHLQGIGDWTGLSLEQTIRKMATCEYHLGCISGPYHVAAALDLKTIAIINFPHADQIFLPVLKDIYQVESDWFLPQHVHLHQDCAGPLVPRFSARTLARAFDGDVYPYWRDDWLGLIYDSL